MCQALMTSQASYGDFSIMTKPHEGVLIAEAITEPTKPQEYGKLMPEKKITPLRAASDIWHIQWTSDCSPKKPSAKPRREGE
jgi:hypothetical protein